MIITKLAFLFVILAVTEAGRTPLKAVSIVYGEINSYGPSYGAYPAPASYGGYQNKPYGSSYPAPAPSSYGGYQSKPYGSSYPAPAQSSYGGYQSKPYSSSSYPSKSYGYQAPSYNSDSYKPSSSYSAYPPKPSSSYSPSYSSGRYKRSTYPQPSYGSYPAPAPAYGGSYNKPSYGTKQTITGTVKFEQDSSDIKYKVNLKVNPPTPGGYGYEEIARSIVINTLGVDDDFMNKNYGSGYGSSSSYATNPYSYMKPETVADICGETEDTIFEINKEAEEVYGYISTTGTFTATIDQIIGRSVVVYKEEGDTSASSGADAIACGTIALTEESS